MDFIRISTLVLIFVSLHTFVIGEDKHMICKTVDDLFTVDGGGRSQHSPITTRRLQGPPGKLGPPGIKGDVGPPGPRGRKGPPGADNNRRINQVEVRLTARIDEIERRFQEKISQLNVTVAEINQSVEERLCNGVFYQGLCYFAIIRASQDMDYNKAVENCRAKSSKPADILDFTHYNMIFEYVRSLTSSSNRYLWLGTTINLLGVYTEVVSLSNGNRASYVKYQSGYPSSTSTRTQMAIKVDQDLSSTNQGMWNYNPAGDLHGVLCQK